TQAPDPPAPPPYASLSPPPGESLDAPPWESAAASPYESPGTPFAEQATSAAGPPPGPPGPPGPPPPGETAPDSAGGGRRVLGQPSGQPVYHVSGVYGSPARGSRRRRGGGR